MELPFNFTNPPVNRLEDYEFGANIKAYLKQRLQVNAHDFQRIMEHTGYQKSEKFKKHHKRWHQLISEIPKKYLEAIGVDFHVLQYVVELDQENFDRVIALEPYPTSFLVRLMSVVHKTFPLGKNIPEAEAIEMVKAFARKHRCLCYIDYPALLTVVIQPDGEVTRIEYRPTLIVKKHWVSFCQVSLPSQPLGTIRV